MKGLDTYMDERFSESKGDDGPCKHCLHDADVHSITPGEPDCSECERLYKPEFWCDSYEPIDPHDNERDEPRDDDD